MTLKHQIQKSIFLFIKCKRLITPFKKKDVSVVFDRLPEEKKKLVSQIRAAIMELDKDILEQVRLHRIVYSKGFAMRDFAELVLERGKVVLRTLSRNYTKTIEIRSAEDIEKALQEAKLALLFV
jgi:hypothetical protein